MKIKNLLMLALLSLAVPAGLFGQNQGTERTADIPRIPKVTLADGWPTPNVKKLTFVHEGSFEIEGRTVAVKSYKTSFMVYDLSLYHFTSEQGLVVRPYHLSIREMVTYQFRGKIYAFKLDLVPVDVSNGVLSFGGPYFIRYFLSQNGDGKFETMFQSLDQPPELDQWVLRQPLADIKR